MSTSASNRRSAPTSSRKEGGRDNIAFLGDNLTFADEITEPQRSIVVDPQTSGGLLISLPAEQAPRLAARLRERGNEVAAVVGEVLPGDGKPGLEFVK